MALQTIPGRAIELGSDAEGDLAYYDGSKWTRLAAGTAGEFLATNSGATAPEWATPIGLQTKALQYLFNTTTAATAVSITGVGFQPKSFTCSSAWGIEDNNMTHSIGDGTDEHMHHMFGDDPAGHWAVGSDLVAYPWINTIDRGTLAFTSFDVDGMTMQWTPVAGATFAYPYHLFYMNFLFLR
jgi:hypothetical protein